MLERDIKNIRRKYKMLETEIKNIGKRKIKCQKEK